MSDTFLSKLDWVDDDENNDLDDEDDDDDGILDGKPAFARPPPDLSNSDPGPCRKRRKIRELLKKVPTGRSENSSTLKHDESSTSTSMFPSSRSIGRKSSPCATTAITSPTTATSNDENDDDHEATARKLQRIEKSARETVEELSLDAIRGVTDFSRLGFSKEGKKLVYTPAIIVDDTSAEIQQKNKRLQEQKTAKRNICIRYLGVEYKYALDYQYISKNQWERLSGDGITVDKEDERRLQTHLKRISGHAEFTNKSSYDNALNLKTEELAIRECWKRVSMQQHEKKAANEDHKLSASDCNTTDLPPHVSQDSQDEEECLQRDDATHAKSSQLDDGSVSAESSDDDSDDDEDDEKASKLSGVSQQRLKQIRVGDEIEFTDPIGTAGDERFRIVTKVEGIRAKGSHKGLIFNSSSVRSLTDFNHQVRLCKVLWKGKQVNVKGTYMPISEFSLKSGGIQTEAEVMQQMIDHGRRAIQKLSDVADQWWQNNSAEGRSAEEPALPPSPPDQVEDSNGAGTKDLGKDSTESDSWYNDAEVALQDRRKIEEERLKTKRRYNPHLSLDQLDVVGKVCKHIHTKSSNDDASVAAILGKISDEYGIPDRKLEALLRGDPERKLSESQVVAHLDSLARWLDE